MAKRIEHYQIGEALLAECHEIAFEFFDMVQPDMSPVAFLQLKLQVFLSLINGEALLANCRLREADNIKEDDDESVSIGLLTPES